MLDGLHFENEKLPYLKCRMKNTEIGNKNSLSIMLMAMDQKQQKS